ncbi:MAG: L,D-transpeptidase [Coriobacteriia bacterium]|nr:L,D-transpeptidase [Coriobacteriia bacterium]
MKRSSISTLARLCCAMAVLGVLLALSFGSVATAASASTPGVPASSTGGPSPATTSTPTTSTPTTSAPIAKVDNRPKAPKFVPHRGKAIYIDRRHQRVYLYVDGRQIDKFKCSTSSTLPRRGTYHMIRKRKQSWSFNGAVTFYWQVIFTVGPHGHNIAFHSVPVNSSGHEIAPVGKPVSHGCVRLPYNKAKFLYHWIGKKTPIVVRP